ncbi:thiopeptide-type bacteriocin biosynthesis protein [Bifidobacterium pullorum subsp. gallinarum]
METAWYSFNVYFHIPDLTEIFIGEVVKSLATDLIHCPFFFVRLLEESPVIKFRVKTKDKEKVSNLILNRLRNYPSGSISKDEYFLRYRPELDPDVWIPHGTMKESNYIPEYERYGGIEIMEMVEESFFLSSYIIGKAYESSLNWVQKVNVSYHMNKILFDQLNISLIDKNSYLEYVGDTWLNYSKSTFVHLNKKQLMKIAKGSLDLEDEILRFDNVLIDEKYLSKYINCIVKIKTKLLKLKPSLLETPQYSDELSDFLKTCDDTYTPLLIISLVHMNNNRLGIFPHSEAALYYVFSNLKKRVLYD